MIKLAIISLSLLTVISCAEKKTDEKAAAKNETAVTKEVKGGKAQTTCPVMEGNPIDKNLYVDVEGKRIYICCMGCVDPIKADPKKYIAKLEAEGVVLENTPK